MPGLCTLTRTKLINPLNPKTNRYRAAFQDRFHQSSHSLADLMAQVSQAPPSARQRLGMFDRTAVKALSLRQLRDAVQNLQLEWNRLRVAETMQPQIGEVVDALFHRYMT